MKTDDDLRKRENERDEDIGFKEGLGRREVLTLAAAAAACAVGDAIASDGAPAKADAISPRELQKPPADRNDALAGEAQVVHSVCLACNAHCGVRGIVEAGRLVSISGNPYHPYNQQFRPLKYETPVKDSLAVPSSVCGKCLETINHTYNPYRVIAPLKRSGPRGSGRFERIEWERMVREVAEGGPLFAHLGEDRTVPGIKALSSDAPIQPSDPDLGPVRNGLVFITGRLQAGRQQFIDRFVKQSFGSINRIGHTDICGLGFRMGNFALTEGADIELKADPESCNYMLVFGANIYEALQPGVNTYGAIVARRHGEGKLKFAVVDPRATKAAAHAEDWVPVKPGQDGALAMAMIRWIIEKKRYNSAYLAAPNAEAAKALGYPCPSNVTHLVICDPEHPNDGRFLRLSDLDPESEEEGSKTFMVWEGREGKPIRFDRVSAAEIDKEGEAVGTTGRKIKVKTAFRLLRESAAKHSLQEYSNFCGVPFQQIEKIAREYTSYGTRAAVTAYHGAGNYVNGTFAAYAIAVLNALIGSVDRKGGYLKGGGGAGGWDKGDYDLAEFPGIRKPKGVPISREKAVYEKSAEFKEKKASGGSGYPAKRPWFGFSAGGLCVEALSGIDEAYPYACGALMTYLFNPVYTIPGGARYIETLSDPGKVPLFISIDTAINESNLYADYIVPDLCYPEGHYGWLEPHAPVMKFTGLRTPMIEPLTGKTEDGRFFSTETFLIDLAKQLHLPGFGEGAIKGTDGAELPLHREEDFYLRAFANIVKNAKVPEASAEEIEWCHRHMVVGKHRDVLPPEQWSRLCYALARGGVFKPYDDSFEGEMFKYGLKRVAIYNEQLASMKSSLTGRRFPGMPAYMGAEDSAGTLIEQEDKEYPFTLISYKTSLHTQSRSIWHAYSLELFPENFILMHTDDAMRLRLKSMDAVRLTARHLPEGVVGKLQVSRSVKPGCLAVSFHYGHTQFGASPVEGHKLEQAFLGADKVVKQGKLIAEPRYGAGINPNALSRLDTHLRNTPLVDLVAGIPDFSNTRVRVAKA
jgi:tetrathionate reductase subunit A